LQSSSFLSMHLWIYLFCLALPQIMLRCTYFIGYGYFYHIELHDCWLTNVSCFILQLAIRHYIDFMNLVIAIPRHHSFNYKCHCWWHPSNREPCQQDVLILHQVPSKNNEGGLWFGILTLEDTRRIDNFHIASIRTKIKSNIEPHDWM